MTINQIVSEGIKELCGARGDVSKIRHTSQAELVNAYDSWDKQEAFIHSFSRKLIESLAEEIIGKVTEIPKTDRNGMSWDSTSFAEAGYEEENAKNDLRAEQRLKVKEIITNLK